MIEYANQSAIAREHRGAVVAIGNFDGLHCGHQKLIELAKVRAGASGKSFGLLTFEPHPRTYFRPQEPVFRLTPPLLKARLAKALGMDFLVNLTFDEAMASTPAEDFITRQLVARLGVSHVITGYDFHFGKARRGTTEMLRQFGTRHGFDVTAVDQVTDDGDAQAEGAHHAPFSSSSIRSGLRRGRVKEAAHELGYHWMVMGEVVHGDKRGRTIGFPTANIILDPGAEPFRGIYALEVRDAAAPPGGKAWMGAGYFGDRPTFNTDRTFLEVYLLDETIDLYGRTLIVSFIDLVRGDKTFRSVDELVIQMTADCEAVRGMFASLSQNRPHTDHLLGRLQAQGLV
jgi:riboflavin kinase / FMN adenylyltransferase